MDDYAVQREETVPCQESCRLEARTSAWSQLSCGLSFQEAVRTGNKVQRAASPYVAAGRTVPLEVTRQRLQ